MSIGNYNYYYATVPYTVFGDNGASLGTTSVNQANTPSSFTDGGGVHWQTLTGTYTIAGTTLTVQISDAIGYTANFGYRVNADAVQAQLIQGNKGADDNLHVTGASPSIDAGDPASAFASEPSPNGGRVNLGYDGNTASAAASPAHEVQILSPSGLEKFPIGKTINVSFRTAGEAAGASVKLEYSLDGGNTYNDTGATGTVGVAGTGTIAWSIPHNSSLTTLGNSVMLRATVVSDNTRGVTSNPFQIVNDNTDFYVSPTGNDTQSGKDAAHPMQSLAALFAAYNLTSADTVHLAAGSYLDPAQHRPHGGQQRRYTIEGSAQGQSLINRGNQVAGNDVFDLVGATGVTMDRLVIEGGNIGINADAGSSNLKVTNSEITGDATGLVLNGNGAQLVNNLIHNNGATVTSPFGGFFTAGPGVIVNGNGAVLDTNQVYNNSIGIEVNGGTALVKNNQVYGNSSMGILVGPQYTYNSNPAVAGTAITGNQVSNNGTGIQVYLQGDSNPADTLLVQGNTVSRNSSYGINAGGNVLLEANQVFGQAGYGVYMSGGKASGNTVDGNANGIYAYGSDCGSQHGVQQHERRHLRRRQ